jgi:hypothetical protein
MLHVVCVRYFHATEMVTSFYIAVFWYNRGMILFCCPKTCSAIIRYVLIFLVLFSLQMQLDEVMNELEANDFGDLVRKCVYDSSRID